MTELIQNIAIGMLIAMMASVITAWIVIQRFRKRFLLEQQMRAYRRIIGALHGMQQHCRWYMRLSEEECSDAELSKQIKEYRKAVSEIDQAADASFLLIGPFFAAELASIQRAIASDNNANDVAHLCRINTLIETFLAKARDVPGKVAGTLI